MRPQLPCSDLERTQRFFENVGFVAKAPAQAGVLTLGCGAITLQFWKVAGARALAKQTACVLEVKSLSEWTTRFRAQGMKFKTEKQPWGAMELSFTDPDGNSIRLAQSL